MILVDITNFSNLLIIPKNVNLTMLNYYSLSFIHLINDCVNVIAFITASVKHLNLVMINSAINFVSEIYENY